MSLIKTVAFDTDGVIAKSDYMHFEIFNEILKHHGFRSLRWESYVNQGYISYDDRRFFIEYLKAQSRKRLGQQQPSVVQLVGEKKKLTLERLEAEGMKVYDYMRPVTKHLARKRINMMEVTGSTQEETTLYFRNYKDIKRRFKVVITADDGLTSKPSPAPYQAGLNRLNKLLGKSIAPNEVIVVEDSVKGIQSAKRAGMYVIGILNTVKSPRELYRAGADVVVKRLNVSLFDRLLSMRRQDQFSNSGLLDRLGTLSCLSDEVNIGTPKEPIFLKRLEWDFRNPSKTAFSKSELSQLVSSVV
jgi:HAD superfamily hydrolase (TIGR01509 family)